MTYDPQKSRELAEKATQGEWDDTVQEEGYLRQAPAAFMLYHSPDRMAVLSREVELLREIESKRTRVLPGGNCEICGTANHTEGCPYPALDALRENR